MKNFSGNRILLACGLTLGLAACGDSSKGTTTTDATTTTATDATTTTTTDATTTTTTDATTTTTTDATTTTNDTADTSTPTCDNTGFTLAEQSFDYNADQDVSSYTATTSGDTVDVLSIEFYPSVTSSDPSPLTGPGTYKIGATEDDQNYATCQTCVLIFSGCDSQSCAKEFFATSGTIEVEALDQEGKVFKGTLKNATLVEVTIDSDTYESTPVANGDTWCISNFGFDSTPECTENADCTGDAAKPFCDQDSLTCVACTSSFDCSASTPVCSSGADGAPACVAKIDECTGDDTYEQNDGPSVATALTIGTAINANACTGASQEELDWYTFTTEGEKNLSAVVTWTETDASLFVVFVSEDGQVVGSAGDAADGKDEQVYPLAPAGKYYAVVVPSDTSAVGNGDTAVAYTLNVTATTPECSATVACADSSKICDTEAGKCVACISDFDCKTAEAPVCLVTDGVAACGTVSVCTDDDAGEQADDGPAGAAALTVPTAAAVSAKICGATGEPSERESDWYKFTLATDKNVTLTLNWSTSGVDLDIALFDGEGAIVDSSVTEQPEVLAETGLKAGTYYVQIVSYDGAATAAVAYTLEATTPQ